MERNIKCPNCGKVCRINEYVNHCSNCGRIFMKNVDIMSDKKIKERSKNRRTGIDVDKLDG